MTTQTIVCNTSCEKTCNYKNTQTDQIGEWICDWFEEKQVLKGLSNEAHVAIVWLCQTLVKLPLHSVYVNTETWTQKHFHKIMNKMQIMDLHNKYQSYFTKVAPENS